MKKQKIRKTINIFVILAVLVGVLGIVNASLYDDFISLEARNCNLEDYGKVSFSETELINKFGLSEGAADCTFILDYLEYEPQTADLVLWSDPWYGEIEHVVDEGHEYILLLGKTHSTLQDIVSVAVNYEDYEDTLDGDADFISFPFAPEPDPEPSSDNCVDNSFKNIYVGNNGSYGTGEDLTYFSSSCADENALLYPYCEGTDYKFWVENCNCIEGKCVASSGDVFRWIDWFGEYMGPGGRIDSELLYSAIKSWINA